MSVGAIGFNRSTTDIVMALSPTILHLPVSAVDNLASGMTNCRIFLPIKFLADGLRKKFCTNINAPSSKGRPLEWQPRPQSEDRQQPRRGQKQL